MTTAGSWWLGSGGTGWFHLEGTVPSEAGERVELLIDLGWTNRSPGFRAEGLIYRPDGQVVKGLNLLNGWMPLAHQGGPYGRSGCGGGRAGCGRRPAHRWHSKPAVAPIPDRDAALVPSR